MREKFEADLEKFSKYLKNEETKSLKNLFEEIAPMVECLGANSAKITFSSDGALLRVKIVFENYKASIDYYIDEEDALKRHIVYSIYDLSGELQEFNSTVDVEWFFEYIINYGK